MKRHLKLTTLLTFTLGALLLVGCSDEGPLNPSTEAPVMENTTVMPTFEDIIESLPAGMTILPVEGDGADKSQTLPSPLLVASETARAVYMLDNGLNHEPWTNFRVTVDHDKLFTVAWFEDIEDDPDPTHVICHMISDNPALNPDSTIEVDPDSDWVDEAARNVISAMAANQARPLPGIEGPGFMWDYIVNYRDPSATTTTYRNYRLTAFRLAMQR